MKRLFIILLLVMMCGCTSNKDINTELDNLLSDTSKIVSNHPNNSLKYYDYYLPSDMGEISFDKESLVLSYLDNKIIVNININDVVNNKYYPEEYLNNTSIFDQNKIIYSKSGQYTTIKNIEKDYLLNLYQNDDNYVVELITSDLTYITSCKMSIRNVVKHFFTIAKSVDLDEELIIADYSDKNIVDYKKKQIDLFDSTRPTSGDLSEMLIGDAIVGNQGSDDDINQSEEELNTEE